MAKGCNLRKGRYSEPGRVYLVTTVTDMRRPLFADFSLGRLLVGEIRGADRAELCETLAFVVMPDHLHWLVRLRSEALSPLVLRVKSRSAIAINRHRREPGIRVWQKGFHDHAVRCDEDLRALARYVIANPTRAGLVRSVRHYPLWDALWLP